MVKSVLGVNHRGYRDWINQRLTGIYMAVYSAAMIFFFLTHPALDYFDWHSLFAHSAMKVATILFVFCLMLHAWIGMWTVVTDYIKPVLLAIFSHTLIFLTLAASFIWSLVILWGI